MMASFKLNQEDRNKLFFNRYKYKASFILHGARFTYFCKSIEEIEKRVKRYLTSPWNIGLPEDISIETLNDFLNWRTANENETIIRTEYERVSVFSNNLKLLKTLSKFNDNIRYIEANVIAKDVLFFEKLPDFKYRVYIKGNKLTDNTADQIISFVDNYKSSKNFRISPSLVNAVIAHKIHTNRWIHNSYFIDYNDESTLSFLKLLMSDLISPKVYKLDANANKDKYSNNMECLNGQDN